MLKKVQAKHVPLVDVLNALLGGKLMTMDFETVFPGFPYKVMLARMRKLKKQGLITGCACGCRGDFQLTPKGRDRRETLAAGKAA